MLFRDKIGAWMLALVASVLAQPAGRGQFRDHFLKALATAVCRRSP
jgi:hypothetical protein